MGANTAHARQLQKVKIKNQVSRAGLGGKYRPCLAAPEGEKQESSPRGFSSEQMPPMPCNCSCDLIFLFEFLLRVRMGGIFANILDL